LSAGKIRGRKVKGKAGKVGKVRMGTLHWGWQAKQAGAESLVK
jgi:hypothetical protein